MCCEIPRGEMLLIFSTYGTYDSNIFICDSLFQDLCCRKNDVYDAPQVRSAIRQTRLGLIVLTDPQLVGVSFFVYLPCHRRFTGQIALAFVRVRFERSSTNHIRRKDKENTAVYVLSCFNDFLTCFFCINVQRYFAVQLHVQSNISGSRSELGK